VQYKPDLAKMVFFKSPRGMKKKAKSLIDVDTLLSPQVGGAQQECPPLPSPKRGDSSSLLLAPPLFHTINDDEHRLLKNLKGTATVRRDSLLSEAVSLSKLQLSFNSIGSDKCASPLSQSMTETKESVAAAKEQSAAEGNETETTRSTSISEKSMPENTDESDDDPTSHEQIRDVVFNGSDSMRSLTDKSKGRLDAQTIPSAPTSPADSIESAKKPGKRASFRSLTSPKQANRSLSLQSACSPDQLQRVPSLRRNQPQKSPSFRTLVSPKQPQKISSFRSAASPQQTTSLRSLGLDDESYVEEYIIDDETYYEEEIIEEEFELSMLDSEALVLVREKKTLVRFDEFDEMQLTLNLDDYTDHELKKTWYKRKDYDEMIQEARQVALKDEQRRFQLQGASQAPKISSHKSELEARGLEAWSLSGALQVRKIKESAIEAVWDEQHRQWEAGIQDFEQLRQAYQKISITSQKEAEERGLADQQVVEKIRQLEELSTSDEVKKKRRRASTILSKSKTFLNKSVKAAGKIARETGKRSTRAGVGAVTLDSRMLLEAIKVEKKKRESKKMEQQERQTYRQPSISAIAVKMEASISNLAASEPNAISSDAGVSSSIRDKGAAIAPLIKARADKLKILRVLPLPGTTKMYDEDRREKKLESRKHDSKKSGFATWEVGLAAGGKL
jgi:hypothetical protein